MDERELTWAGELHQRRHQEAAALKEYIENIAQSVAAKLNKQIEQGHETGAFLIMIMLAIFKDGLLDILLDFLFIGMIPVIGQIPGWFVSAVIFYFMWGKGWFLKFRLHLWFYALSFIIDGLPLFEELPITTLTVLYAWHNVRKWAKEAEEKLQSLDMSTKEELEELDQVLTETASYGTESA